MKTIIFVLFVIANTLSASDELKEIGHYSMPDTEINSVHVWQNFAYLRTRSKIFKINIDNPQIPSMVDSIAYLNKAISRAGYFENYAIVAYDSLIVKFDLSTMSIADTVKHDYNIGTCRFVVNDSFLVVPTATDSGVYIYNIKNSLTRNPAYNYKNNTTNPVFAVFKNSHLAFTRSWYYGIARYYDNQFSNGELKYFSDPRPAQIHALTAFDDYYLTNDYSNGGSEASNILVLRQVYYNADKGERKCYLNQMGNGSSIYSTVEYQDRIIATTDSSLFVIAINSDNNLEVVLRYPAPSSRLASNDKYLFVGLNGLQVLAPNNTGRVEEPTEELPIVNGCVRLNQETNEVIIFDINGVELKRLHNNTNIDVSNLRHGVYFIKVDKRIYKINI